MSRFGVHDLYRNLFTLWYDNHADLEYVENMTLYEYEVFNAMLRDRLMEEEMARMTRQALNG